MITISQLYRRCNEVAEEGDANGKLLDIQLPLRDVEDSRCENGRYGVEFQHVKNRTESQWDHPRTYMDPDECKDINASDEYPHSYWKNDGYRHLLPALTDARAHSRSEAPKILLQWKKAHFSGLREAKCVNEGGKQ